MPPNLGNLNQFSQITFLTAFDAMVLKLSALARQSNIIGQPPKRGTGFEGKRCRKIIFAVLLYPRGATRATEAERPAQIEANDQTKTLEQNRQRRNFAAELKKEKAKATQKGQKMHFSCKKNSE